MTARHDLTQLSMEKPPLPPLRMTATPEERAVIAAAEAWADDCYGNDDDTSEIITLADAVRALRALRGPTPDDTYTALEAEGWHRAAGVGGWSLTAPTVYVRLYVDDDSVELYVDHVTVCPDEGSAVRLARQLATLLEQ